METLVLNAADDGAISRAVALLEAGDLVALPTETVYGLAGDAGRQEAAAAIFHAKERPFFDPLIVHLPTLASLERVTIPPPGTGRIAERLVERFWPGPLTILLPRRAGVVPDLITAGSELVAVRMSAHPVFRAVIEALGRPLAAPSANRFGRISPTSGAHVFAELAGRIPLVLEAGPTTHGLESTIVAIAPDGSLGILRHGPITEEMLAEFGPVRTLVGLAGAAASAPGQGPGHYAPRTPLEIRARAEMVSDLGALPKTGLLAFRRDHGAVGGAFAPVEYLTEAGDLREAAVRFFAALRRLDDAGVEKIVAEPLPEIGLGRAIMERLRRAAAGSGPLKPS